MRAIVYAAKSTTDTRGSIPTQITDCRTMAQREGWEIVAEYQDEAFSGYHGDRGPGLAKAREHAARVAAEEDGCVLMAQHSDRFARGDGLQAQHLAELWFAVRREGVELRTVQDDGTFTSPLLIMALGERNTEDSRRKALAVKSGMGRAADRGQYTSRTPFGYRREGRGPDSTLVVAPAQAEVVKAIFTDYVGGMSAREITRVLNAAGTPTAGGGVWQRSAVARVLANVAYLGKLHATGDDGEPLPGKHEPIIDEDVWQRAQAIRAGHLKRKSGRHPDGGHLLVKGLLRCRCGAAMKPMHARSGIRSVYRCSGRIEHGADFCSQPGIPREAIDEPFLRVLLDSYTDLAAMRQRIADQADSALANARRAVADREAEVAKLERAMDATERAWDAGDIDARQYAKREARLTDELAGARAALDQALEHAESASYSPPSGDPERELLDHLAALKAAVADGVEHAPNLNALRNVLAELFEEVRLVRSGEWPQDTAHGFIPWHDAAPTVCNGQGRYWLLLTVRSSLVDSDTLEPTPVELPAPALMGAKP